MVTRAIQKGMTNGRAEIRWDNGVEKAKKDVRGNQDDTVSAGKRGGH